MGRFVGDMTWPRFLLGYFVIVLGSVSASIWAHKRFGVPGERVLLIVFAAVFLMAAAGRPAILYQIVRNTGWFAAIDSDRAMRSVLLVASGALAVAAAFTG